MSEYCKWKLKQSQTVLLLKPLIIFGGADLYSLSYQPKSCKNNAGWALNLCRNPAKLERNLSIKLQKGIKSCYAHAGVWGYCSRLGLLSGRWLRTDGLTDVSLTILSRLRSTQAPFSIFISPHLLIPVWQMMNLGTYFGVNAHQLIWIL